jgi:large subunit ribosomal protein L20
MLGTNYSRLIAALKAANIGLDRKILSALATHDLPAFQAVLEAAGIKIVPETAASA